MARTPNRRQRETSRQRVRAAAEARHAATRRRQRIIAGAVASVVVLSVAGAYLGSRSDSTTTSTSTTASPTTPSSGSLPDDGVTPTAVPMGQTLTGPVACPAQDGSSPRVTLFDHTPPACIDPAFFYVATISTTKGDLAVQLNPKRAPQAVNDFVVLARYHFYDGQPVTSVRSRASFTIGLAFSGDDADRAPGFAIPDEAPPEGQVFTPGMLAMVPSSGGSPTSRGQLLVATFEEAAGIDQGVTGLGIMLSGDATLAAVDALATATGQPSEPVRITSIDVIRTSAIPA